MPNLIHITDLHIDHWPSNLPAMIILVKYMPGDLILIGGDNGNDEGLVKTVEALKQTHPKADIAWVMGNHDLWNGPYTHLWDDFSNIPATYLESKNLETRDCTVVGTYGHYDYSGGTSLLSHAQYETFTDGRQVWNDRYIERLGRTNPEIAREIADRFQERYKKAVARGLPIVVLTHTWPFAPTEQRYRSFTSAYCCNQLIGDILISETIRPTVLFCGHTHQASRWDDFGFPMVNTGSDYKKVRVTPWEIPERKRNWWRFWG